MSLDLTTTARHEHAQTEHVGILTDPWPSTAARADAVAALDADPSTGAVWGCLPRLAERSGSGAFPAPLLATFVAECGPADVTPHTVRPFLDDAAERLRAVASEIRARIAEAAADHYALGSQARRDRRLALEAGEDRDAVEERLGFLGADGDLRVIRRMVEEAALDAARLDAYADALAVTAAEISRSGRAFRSLADRVRTHPATASREPSTSEAEAVAVVWAWRRYAGSTTDTARLWTDYLAADRPGGLRRTALREAVFRVTGRPSASALRRGNPPIAFPPLPDPLSSDGGPSHA